MSDSECQFRWSDAWLLTAIYGATLGGEPTLARVVGIGDFINHAVFTLSQLNGGLSRLQKAGLISIQSGLYPLTPKGREVTEIDPKAKKGPFEHLETIRKRLSATDWRQDSDPNDAEDPSNPTVYVTEEVFQEARDEYRQLLKQRPK